MPGFLGYRNKRNFYLTYLTIFAIALNGYIVRNLKFKEYNADLQIYVFFVSLVLITVTWESLRFVNRYLNRKLPFEKGVPKRVATQLVIGSFIGLAVRFVIYHFGEPMLPFRLDNLFVATTWVLYATLPAGINLGFFTAHFIDRWKNSIIVAERLEKEKARVQFDNLKNQLNPHFLFNALTSLNSLIHEDQKLASEFLQQLSKVYRYVLKNKENTVVSLDTELDFIAHYVSLLRTRFAESFFIEFNIPDSVKSNGIVPVTLQILIENAIKHNVVDKARPLVVRIYESNGYLCISNNLQIRKRVEDSNQQGLENLRALYRYLTDRPVEIGITGDQFIVKVPLL